MNISTFFGKIALFFSLCVFGSYNMDGTAVAQYPTRQNLSWRNYGHSYMPQKPTPIYGRNGYQGRLEYNSGSYKFYQPRASMPTSTLWAPKPNNKFYQPSYGSSRYGSPTTNRFLDR